MYRLLIAHEDPEVCTKLLRALDWRRYGFTGIATAGSYVEAVNKILDQPPHVCLTGEKLCTRLGCEMLSQFRRQGIKTVFAVVSASRDPELMRRAMQAGARDFLCIPVDPKELRSFAERTVVMDLGGRLPQRGGVPEKLDPVLRVDCQSMSKLTNKILLYTSNYYRQPLSLVHLAEVFKMSSKYMGRVFLQDTGMKYSEYLMAYRMLEARKLVVGTQNKISVIASMVGYSQLNNFYIHFKRYFGASPGDLRHSDGNEQ